MPFCFCDLGNLDKDPITGPEIKIWRPLDNELYHARWQYNALLDVRVAMRTEAILDPIKNFHHEDYARHEKPLPIIRRVYYKEHVKHDIKQVTVVENLIGEYEREQILN